MTYGFYCKKCGGAWDIRAEPGTFMPKKVRCPMGCPKVNVRQDFKGKKVLISPKFHDSVPDDIKEATLAEVKAHPDEWEDATPNKARRGVRVDRQAIAPAARSRSAVSARDRGARIIPLPARPQREVPLGEAAPTLSDDLRAQILESFGVG